MIEKLYLVIILVMFVVEAMKIITLDRSLINIVDNQKEPQLSNLVTLRLSSEDINIVG